MSGDDSPSEDDLQMNGDDAHQRDDSPRSEDDLQMSSDDAHQRDDSPRSEDEQMSSDDAHQQWWRNPLYIEVGSGMYQGCS